MKWRGLIVALAAYVLPLPADAAPAIESFELANGLEVVVIPNHRVPAVSHMLWYRVGAADDPPGKSGLAHYHEHMMFEGTVQYKAGEFADIVARHGGEQNAFTGHDATSFYVNIAKEKLPLVMGLEADRMRGLALSASSIDKEKQVILEERRLRIENSPAALLSEQMNAALFRHHPYHLPVIGWMHEMEALSGDDVLKFHRKWYHPNNAILIVSGDITAKELRPLAEKYYGGLARGGVPPRRWNAEPPQLASRRVELVHPNVEQPVWARSYVVASLASAGKEQAMPLFALSQVLGGGKTSRLYQSLVVEQKLASEIDVDYDGFALGPATFRITAVPAANVDLAALERAIDKELDGALKEGIAEAELARAKTLLKAETIFARDGLTSMARIMGWLRIAGLGKDDFNRWPEMIDGVTAAQATAAGKEALQLRRSVTGLLLPVEIKEEK